MDLALSAGKISNTLYTVELEQVVINAPFIGEKFCHRVMFESVVYITSSFIKSLFSMSLPT